jgi:hypothetical protein
MSSSVSDNKIKTAQSVRHLSFIRKYFPDISGAYRPSIFPLGYYVKRSEPRLLYVMPISMEYEKKTFKVKTRNISEHGLQIYMPRTFLMTGRKVTLSFDKFIQEQNSMLGGDDEFTRFENIEYMIKDVHHTPEKTYISLEQVNLPAATQDFIHRFINGSRIRYKIDATDRIFASKAQYYENLYTINMQHVPMFVRWNREKGFHIDTMIKTQRNHHFFDFIGYYHGQADHRPFTLPARIEKFAELARFGQSCLFFAYREDNELHTLFDFELSNEEDFLHIIYKVSAKKGRIYKVSTNLNKRPAADKITSMLSKIQKIDAIASRSIDSRASESIAQVIFTDITRVFSRQQFFSAPLHFKPGQPISLSVLKGYEKVRMADGFVLEQFNHDDFHLPELINFDIGHSRYDPRYQYEMNITIHHGNHKYSAKTIDFSRSGLGLVIQEETDIDKDSDISITFSSLILKGITTQLNEIPHKVMLARRTEDGLFLGVIRNSSHCHPEINRFFSKLVKRNRGKLDLCLKDKIDSVSTTFFEAFVTENIQTIPIVITRDKNNHHYIKEIGLNEKPCPLAEKLYIKGHGYDFHFLTTELRLSEIHQRAIKATDKAAQSFMLFLFKADNEEGQESIFSVTDFEMILDEQLEEIIKLTLENDGACVRVQFINNLIIDKLYQTMTLDKVDELNKAASRLLAHEYKDILGFAELLDLTEDYRKQYTIKYHNESLN